jgi:hypothetical protein
MGETDGDGCVATYVHAMSPNLRATSPAFSGSLYSPALLKGGQPRPRLPSHGPQYSRKPFAIRRISLFCPSRCSKVNTGILLSRKSASRQIRRPFAHRRVSAFRRWGGGTSSPWSKLSPSSSLGSSSSSFSQIVLFARARSLAIFLLQAKETLRSQDGRRTAGSIDAR